ncbi:MAG: heparinase [Rhodobacteraceae bacterium]|nr:heparinase [Paracoccaceae bacterium]
MTEGARLHWYPMAIGTACRRRWLRWRDYLSLRMARFAPPAKAFKSQPDPRSYGLATRGLQVLAGNHLVQGDVIEQGKGILWGAALDDPDAAAELHGFNWLDDVVAVDTPEARKQAQLWLFDWIDRFGGGRGSGWAPDVTGRRVVRWINHAILILHQAEPAQSRAYFAALGHQSRFLMKRWKSAHAGLPRFEALTGLVYCGLALEGQDHVLKPALRALGRECQREIAEDGGIASRNPEELVEIFTLLSSVNQTVSADGDYINPEIIRALQRMAPAIRALRVGDGTMARFHGGDAGHPDRIDQALADAGIGSPAREGGAMGFARLAAGGTVVLMDSAKLPVTGAPDRAHASTLAIEMYSGKLPVLVSMGSARGFSANLHSAARATAAHSAVTVAGTSLARFAGSGFVRRIYGQQLIDAPRKITLERDNNQYGQAVLCSHDGYVPSFGLIHSREIAVLHSGAEVQGHDRIFARSPVEQSRFETAAADMGQNREIPFAAHFRLHPDARVDLDMADTAASITLPNEEVWLLRAGGLKQTLHDTLYFEQGRLAPRATKEVVVTSAVVEYEGVIRWTLSRPA